MAIVGRLHPLLVHFPIALVIAAGAAESAAIVTHKNRRRTVAVANVRGGAVLAFMTLVWGAEFLRP